MKLASGMTSISFDTPIGTIYVSATEKGISYVGFKKPAPSNSRSENIEIIQRHLKNAKDQLIRYFSGELKKFEMPLDLKGTEFQKKVWSELQRIPFGETVSYLQLSKKLENPKAVRAVGTANGKNPICVLVPCHRVIASDGSLGGYSGGLDKKEKLLSLEKIGFRKNV